MQAGETGPHLQYHPRGYVRPEDGGAAAEHEALTHHVTMWNVAVERQIRVQGPDAERFVDYVVTRDATRIKPLHGKYVILCNERGGILNDPVLLRLAEDEFWFSLADSDLLFWLQGVNVGLRMDVRIDEIDVCPVQIQGPKSEALMVDLPARRHPARREAVVRGAGGGQGAPALGDRARPPAPHPGRNHVLGPGYRPRYATVPVQPGLSGSAQKEGGLYRQGGAGTSPRTGRRRPAAVHHDNGGHDPRRGRDALVSRRRL